MSLLLWRVDDQLRFLYSIEFLWANNKEFKNVGFFSTWRNSLTDCIISFLRQAILMSSSGCSALREHGASCDRRQPRFLLYPPVVVGHPGVNPWPKLLCTAIAPADYSKQEEPVADLTHQRSSRVSLAARDASNHKSASQSVKSKKYPVWTCREYLTGVLAPVGTSSTKHIVSDHISIMVLLLANIVGKEIHLRFSKVLRLVPQTCANKREKKTQKSFQRL